MALQKQFKEVSNIKLFRFHDLATEIANIHGILDAVKSLELAGWDVNLATIREKFWLEMAAHLDTKGQDGIFSARENAAFNKMLDSYVEQINKPSSDEEKIDIVVEYLASKQELTDSEYGNLIDIAKAVKLQDILEYEDEYGLNEDGFFIHKKIPVKREPSN